MLLLAVGVCFTLLVAYVVYVLVSSDGSNYADNSLDAFIDTSAPSQNAGKTFHCCIQYCCI